MRHRPPGQSLPTLAAEAIMLALLAAGALRYDHFASPSNLSNLFNDYSYVFIAAAGATLVILLGGIDLSVGSLVALSGVIAAVLIARGWHPLAAATVCLLAGAAAGATMGGLIQLFQLPAFMVTLAGMFALRACAFLILDQSAGVAHPFLTRSARSGLDLPAGAHLSLTAALAIAVIAAAWVTARLTPFGRNIYALGGSERSARAMGVPVALTRTSVYAAAGLCSALAGVVFTFDHQSADPGSSTGLELAVIASVVIGGTLLSGGVGSVAGTVLGVLILGLIRMLIDFQGNLNAAWTSIATGALLLAFVALQRVITARAAR